MDSLRSYSEDNLNGLVSIAIRRAELLDEMRVPSAAAWREVLLYEQQLAEITSASTIPGGIARVGAVSAALACGERQKAAQLAQRYRAETGLWEERRRALDRAFRNADEAFSRHHPGLARRRKPAEIEELRAKSQRIFPHLASAA